MRFAEIFLFCLEKSWHKTLKIAFPSVYYLGMEEKNIIEKLLKIESEQRSRDLDPLKNYNKDKVHAKQMAFHKCPSATVGFLEATARAKRNAVRWKACGWRSAYIHIAPIVMVFSDGW